MILGSSNLPDAINFMAHTRKDTLTAPPEWWKHLRPFNKRKVAKAERKAAKKEIKEEIKYNIPR